MTTVSPKTIPLRLMAAVSLFEAFVSDRIMKYVAATSFQHLDHELNNIVDVTYHQNFGLIGNLPVPLPIILFIVLLAIVFVGRKILELPSDGEKLQAIALGMILGGALGNLFDRVVYGYVIDWILLGGRSVINLADISIATGALIYVFAPKTSSVDSTPKKS
jgi:signal peptidase II